MIDWIILALLAGVVTLTALLLYPQPISWSDEEISAKQNLGSRCSVAEKHLDGNDRVHPTNIQF